MPTLMPNKLKHDSRNTDLILLSSASKLEEHVLMNEAFE